MQTFQLEKQTWIVSPTGERIRLEKELGSGSFGSVYAAGEDKIIKILRSNDAMTEKNLLQEITIQEKLAKKEPGVCPKIYDFGKIEQTGQYVIIMEKCDGTVRDLLIKEPTEENFLDYYEQVAKIISRLEKYSFSHRDLKSDNVMYKTDPQTGKKTFLLIDFGFSCATFDGVRYASTMYFAGPNSKCFRRSRDLAQLVFDSISFTNPGNLRIFIQLVLTFNLNGKRCAMIHGCPPWFQPTWGATYRFLDNDAVENPNTTPEGLQRAVQAYRKTRMQSCKTGTVVNPMTEQCVPTPDPPPASAMKEAKTPQVLKPAARKTRKNAKKCPAGKVVNPETGRCVTKKCKPGKVRNEAGRCAKPKPKKCPPGKALNRATGRCKKETSRGV